MMLPGREMIGGQKCPSKKTKNWHLDNAKKSDFFLLKHIYKWCMVCLCTVPSCFAKVFECMYCWHGAFLSQVRNIKWQFQ